METACTEDMNCSISPRCEPTFFVESFGKLEKKLIDGVVGSDDGTLNGKILISQPSSGQWGSLGVWWCIETLLETGYCMMMT